MVNGNIPATVITGGRVPGSSPERANRGNQDIGKITKEVTDGIKAAGSDKGAKFPEIEKPRFGRGFLNKRRLISAITVVISFLEITTATASVSTTGSTSAFFTGFSY